MLAISANLAAALRLDGARPVWYVEIDKSEGTTDPLGHTSKWPGTGEAQTRRIFSDGAVGWSTRAALIAAGALHEDRLDAQGVGDIVRVLPSATRDPGGLAGTDSVDVRIDNTDGGLSGNPLPRNQWFVPDPAAGQVPVQFEGRRVRVYLTEASLTSRSDSLLVFTGKANDVQPDGDAIVLTCESDVVAWDVDVPNNIFTSDEITDAGVLPHSTIGKPIPMVFGAHDMAPGYVTADVTDDGTADTGRRVVFADVAKLPIKSIASMRYGDQGLVKATGGFASIKSAPVPNLSGTSTFTVDLDVGGAFFDDPEDELLLLYADIRITVPARHAFASSGNGQGTNPQNAVDGNAGTYGSINLAGSTGYYAKYLTFKIPAMGVGGVIEKSSDKTGIFVLYRSPRIYLSVPETGSFLHFGAMIDGYGVAADRSDGDANLDLHPLRSFVRIDHLSSPATIDTTANFNSPPTEDDACQLMCRDTAWGEYSSLSGIGGKFLSFFLYMPSDAVLTTSDCRIAEFFLRVYFGLETPDDGYYADLEGYKDRDALVTGVANQLIEHPADIAVALLCYWTPAPYADGAYTRYPFDAASQAAARAARPGWKFAKSLTDKEKFSALAESIGREAHLWFYVDAAGALAVAPWDASDRPVLTLTPPMLADGEIDAPERSRLEDLVTEFEFRFKENTVRGEFDETLFCKADSSSTGLGAEFESLCAWAKFNNGGTNRKETYDFTWIRDRDTAIEAAKRTIRHMTSRRWGFTAPCDLEQAAVEIGDRVEFDALAAWPRSYDAGMLAAKYRIYEINKSPEKSTVTFKAAEVFN